MLLAAAAAAAWLAWFAHRPVALPSVPYQFTVRAGSSLKTVARELAAGGLFAEGESFWILGRTLGRAGAIRAGTYRLDTPLTPLQLLDKLARGDVVLVPILFVEGSTFHEWLAQLDGDAKVRHTLAGKSDEEIRALLGITDR